MAFKEPSGLMGKPESLENYTVFVTGDVKFYIDNSVLEKYLNENMLLINIEGYGRHQFEIEE